MKREASILLAEDDESDVLLLRLAFEEAGVTTPLQVARDGQEAVEILQSRMQPPDDRLPWLVILDLKMPRKHGLEVLQWMRKDPILRTIPVIIFSSSAHRGDIDLAYAYGANGFFVKPPSIGERNEFATLVRKWVRYNQPPLVCAEGIDAARAEQAVRPAFAQGAGLP